MGPLLLTILIVLLVGGLAIWGDSRRRGHPTPPCKDRRGATNAKDVPVNLRYGRVELTFLHRYANVHDVELGGRYDIRTPPLLNIWTHNWITPGCRQESSLMFSLEFNWKTASLISVKLQPGYDWAVFLDELARLERAALGGVMFGKRRGERIT